MGLITQKIDGIGLGGVSQMPPEYRQANQVTDLFNAIPSVKYGVYKRPPTVNAGRLISGGHTGFDTAFYHFLKSTDGTRYVMVVTGGSTIRVFSATTGAELTVYSPNGFGYLGSPSSNPYRAVTVGDYTFLLNQSKTVAAATAKYAPPVTAPIAYVEVRQTDYSIPYTINLNNGQIVVTTTTGANTSSASRANIESTKVAADIATALAGNALFTASFSATRDGSIISIRRINGADFAISTTDGLGEAGLRLTKERIQTLEDLPQRADSGVALKVEGNPGSAKDDTWVVYQNDQTINGGSVAERRGTWKETLAPGTPLRLDATTMPWALIKNGPLELQKKQSALPPVGYVLETAANYVRFQFDPTAKYPPGYRIQCTIRVDSTLDYTVPGTTFKTGSQVATALAASFVQGATDTGAGHTFTVTNPNTGEVKVQDSAAATPSQTLTETPPANTFWSWDLSMTPTAHVGRTLKNLTDGCSGVITSNGTYHITCSGGLSGGSSNTFTEGDTGGVYIVGSTYFVFDKLPWSDRLVGSLDSSPWPSFVGRAISDIFFHENRMGFVSGDGVVLSAANDLLRLFRRTTTSVLADDPIDVKNATKYTASFEAAVPWDNGVLLVGSSGYQFLLSGDPVMTPMSVRLDYLCAVPTSIVPFRPFVFGKRVRFFRQRSDNFCDCTELYRDRYGAVQIEELTKHIPTYLSGVPSAVVADATLGMMFFATRPVSSYAGARQLYLHMTSFDGEDRIQNAWSSWDSTADVYAMDVTDGVLTLVTVHNGSNSVEIDTVNLWAPPDPMGATMALKDATNGALNVHYQFQMTLSPPVVRDKNGAAVTSGRLQVRNVKVLHGGANQIRLDVAPHGRATKTYTLSIASTTPGETVKVPVLCDSRHVDSIDIYDDMTLDKGMVILGVEFESYLVNRSRTL